MMIMGDLFIRLILVSELYSLIMKPFVITIEDLKESVDMQNVVLSLEKYGIKVNKFSAFTPKDDPLKFFKEEGLSPMGFDEDRKYSRRPQLSIRI